MFNDDEHLENTLKTLILRITEKLNLKWYLMALIIRKHCEADKRAALLSLSARCRFPLQGLGESGGRGYLRALIG